MFKKQYAIVLLALILLFCSGCMRFEDYHSDLTKEFEKEIKQYFPDIKSFDVKYNSPSVGLSFKMTSNTDSDTVKEIFKQTRAFFLSEEFQQEFFKCYFEKYKNDYSSDENHYPQVDISFDITGDKTAEYDYKSVAIQPGGDKEYEYKYWILQKQDGSIEDVVY